MTPYVSDAEDCEGLRMGKRNKSKRFFQQSKDAVSKHDEKFTYRMTFSEAEARKASCDRNSKAGCI